MQRSSCAWLGFTLLAFAVQLCSGNMLAAQAAAPIQSSGQRPQTIVLPEEIPAGESATLAVLDSDGRIVPGATVQVSGGARVTTDAMGRAMFIAPAQAGMLTARLNDGASFTSEVTPERLHRTTFTSAAVIALADRFGMRGPGLSPDASRIRVVLDGEPALVLASSSVSLVALPNPRTPLGGTELSIEVAGRSVVRAPVVVVSLAVTGPTIALGKGKKGMVQVAVSGTKEKLSVEMRNLSPDVVRFPRGNVVQRKTSGGANNIAKIEVTGVSPGDYAVSARFVEEAEGAR